MDMTLAGRNLRGVAVWALAFWSILPLVPLVIWSFAHGWRFPDVLPAEFTLSAWSFAWSDASGVLASFGVTAGIAAATTLAALVIGLPAARALGMHEFRGKLLVQTLILAPVLVPGIAIALGLHGVFLALGLTNSILGVVLVHLVPALPYMILILSGVFSAHDVDFEDQARSLGAGPMQTLWHVTLPAILPGVVVACLFTFLISWSQFLLTLMIGGGRVVTMPLLLFGFATSGRNDLTGAIALIYILPGIVLLCVTSRFLTGRPAAIAGLARA
jgi:putative spermidine/putrescine transport system permease protein